MPPADPVAPPVLPDPVARFDAAQRRTIAMARELFRRLEAGMSERDLFELAETQLGTFGFSRWYHPPEIRIGGRTFGPLVVPSARRRLAAGELVAIDLAPAEDDCYGDFCATVAFGGPEPKVVGVARDCVRATCGYASRWKTVGELFIFAKAWAVNERMDLANRDSVGHRVLPREGLLATGFPRSAHLATFLGRNRVHRLNPVRMAGMFAIRPEVVDHGQVAAFEEIVWVQDEVRWVLGRDNPAEAGRLEP